VHHLSENFLAAIKKTMRRDKSTIRERVIPIENLPPQLFLIGLRRCVDSGEVFPECAMNHGMGHSTFIRIVEAKKNVSIWSWD
jgi:hypothetical protein